MDDALPQDETTLHTPNVLPYYDLTNCTFKEESITMGDDVIAGQENSDNDLDEDCTFKVDLRVATKCKFIDKGSSRDEIITAEHVDIVSDTGDVKMEEIVVTDSNKPRPPALILSKNQLSLSSSFKQIVDETLSDETTSQPAQPIVQNVKTIIVKPLPKLTRILPMLPVTTTDRNKVCLNGVLHQFDLSFDSFPF